MKRTVGSRTIHEDQGEQPRTARRVSGTVRVSNVSKANEPRASRIEHDASAAGGAEASPPHVERVAQGLTSTTSMSEYLSGPSVVAGGVVLGSIVAHFALPKGWPQLVVPFAPLAFAWVARHDNRRLHWAVRAGLFWFMLAWVELLQPMAGLQSALYRWAELTVLGVILVQLLEGARFMQHLSQRDPLTGLLNRRGFEELSASELKRAARYDRPIAFALLDVDRFKTVNDQFGHAAGDRVLRIVAEELLGLRTSDVAVRLGGDEFGLLMPETDELGAEQLIARLQQRIHMRMFEQGWPVTISAGIATSAQCRRRLPDLMAAADTRMYASKHAARA